MASLQVLPELRLGIPSCSPPLSLDLPGLTWGPLFGSPAPDTGSFLPGSMQFGIVLALLPGLRLCPFLLVPGS